MLIWIVVNLRAARRDQMQPQQTGGVVHEHAAHATGIFFSIVAMQSQQDWIISAQALSPLVQVTDIPLSDISHLHIPMGGCSSKQSSRS